MKSIESMDRLMSTIVVALIFVAAMMVFVYMPVAAKTEAECLRAGYPKSAVTIWLDRYCMNMQGAVTTVVVPQK